jgi:hypothetical protein
LLFRSIHRDLNWDWDILNDRVRYGFIDRYSHRDRPVNWDTDRVRYRFLNRNGHELLHWDLDGVCDLLGVCQRLQKQAHALPISVRSTG